MWELKTKAKTQKQTTLHEAPFNPRRESWLLLNSWLMLCLVLALLWPQTGFAAETEATSLGAILCNLRGNATIFPYILSVSCYCVGMFLVVNGVMTLRKHAEGGGQSQVVPGIAKLLSGGMFTLTPVVAKILQKSVMGGSVSAGNFECTATATSTDASSLDVMMTNFVQNIYTPMETLLSAVCVVVGVLFIARGIMASAKIGSDPRAGSPKTIIVNFVIGALLISAGQLLDVTMFSVFGSKSVNAVNKFSLNWSKITDNADDFSKVDATVQAILGFIQILGMIGFVRGWMVLKAAIEGGGQATVPQGLTFVIGGAMAINIGKMLTIMDSTFGTGMVKSS